MKETCRNRKKEKPLNVSQQLRVVQIRSSRWNDSVQFCDLNGPSLGMFRFIPQLKQAGTGTGPLTGEEIQDAEILILKGVRRDTFASKIACIKRNFSRVATARHSVVPGQQRALTSDRKTSVAWQVLQRTPSDCTVKTPSLLSFACISSPPRLLYGGVRNTLAQLREQYWIVQRRQLVEKDKKMYTLSANEPKTAKRGNCTFACRLCVRSR